MARRVIGGLVNHATGTPLGPYKDVDSQAKQLDDHNANYVELYNALGLGGSGLVTDSAPGSGALTNYAPTGFGPSTAFLDIVADDAGTTINDLPIGTPFQRVRVRNKGLVGELDLANANAGSTAAKRFSGAGPVGLPPGDCIDIVYYPGSVNRWIM